MVTRAFVCYSRKLILLVSLLTIFEAVDCASKWPSWVKPCRIKDGPVDDCIARRIAEAQPNVINGYPKARIPKLDPLTVTSIAVDTGSKQVGLSLKLYDCLIYGLKSAVFYKAHVDFEKKHYDLYWRNERLMVLGQYVMDGKVLLLPIQGTGDGNVTLTDVTGDFRFDYELIPKKGLNVAKITNSSMTFTVGKAYFDLKNLFNGDKYLGAQMNNFLNENYAEVIREFGPAVGDAFNQVFRSIMQGGFDLVPIETAYPDLGHYPDKP
uniref:Protein takeout n=1 Tax=Cacopsylla melanoneura TaxID=428564 RepID=A0A8D9BPB8_9HEMI